MNSTEEELCYKPVLSKYFTSFAGVCRREDFRDEFWNLIWRSFLFGLISFPISVIVLVLITAVYDEPSIEVWAAILSIGDFVLWYILVGINYYQSCSKRLHAFGKSATYWLIVPAISCNIIEFFLESGFITIISIIYHLCLFIFLLYR